MAYISELPDRTFPKPSEAAGSKDRPVGSLLSRARAKTAFLGIGRIVETLSDALRKAGARNVEAAVSDRTAQLAIDEEMNEAFATLGSAVAPETAVTILGGLVGMRVDDREERKGCALLSVSVRGEHEPRGIKKGVRALQRIIRRHRGAFKARQGGGEIRIDLYLPVLRGS